MRPYASQPELVGVAKLNGMSELHVSEMYAPRSPPSPERGAGTMHSEETAITDGSLKCAHAVCVLAP